MVAVFLALGHDVRLVQNRAMATRKLDALDSAESLLETAIYLWFKSWDDRSILLLAASAHEVIARLGKKKGITPVMFEGLSEKAKWRLQATQDFLKHGPDNGRGKSSPRAPIIVDGHAERFIKDAIEMHGALTEWVWPDLFLGFQMYLSTHSPELYPPEFAAKHGYFSRCHKLSREQMLEHIASRFFPLIMEDGQGVS